MSFDSKNGGTLFGLIKSNNASAFILLAIFSLIYYVSRNKQYKKKIILSSGVVSVFSVTMVTTHGLPDCATSINNLLFLFCYFFIIFFIFIFFFY